MFDKLRGAFSSAAKSFSEKELKEKDIDEILSQLEISLMESDVATEVVDSIKADLKKKLIGIKVEKHEIESFVKKSLIQNITELFDAAGQIDVLSMIASKKKSSAPFIIVFVGINGTGKTTTLAKFAYLLQKSKFSVVVAAADTFRAGAIEQLREHTNRLNLKLVAQNYGSDPAAVAKDAELYAKSHKIDCVLVDTAGRMQTSKNLMDQIAKIVAVVKPDLKIFVGDSLAGNDTVSQAREFYEQVKFDGSILTKSDADARGGAALSIVKVTSTPILYVGVGQEYPDLKLFGKESFLETIFGKTNKIELSTNSGSQTSVLESKTDTLPPPPPPPQHHQHQSPKPEQKEEEEVKKEKEKTPLYEQPSASPQSQSEKQSPTLQPEPQQKKPIPEPSVKSPPPPEPKPAQSLSEDGDPFEGIKDNDINRYADLFDVAPPENDNEAKHLASKIKKWIMEGRPKPNE